MVAAWVPYLALVTAISYIIAKGIGRNGGRVARSHTEHQGTELLPQSAHRNFPGIHSQLT